MAILVTLATGIITIVSWFRGVAATFTFVYYVSLVAFVAVAIIVMLKLQKVSGARLTKFSEDFHRFTHFLRDEQHVLEKLCERNELTRDLLLEHMKSTGQRIVNLIENSLTASTGKDFFVSIQYLSRPASNMKEAQFATLCRSTNTVQARLTSNPRHLIVGKNTHLTKLIIDGYDDFAKRNLLKYKQTLERDKESPYLNEENNWQDHYRCCLFVPIRLEKRLNRKAFDDEEGYHVIGVLAADSMSVSAIQKRELASYVQLLKAYADACYNFFEECLQYQEKLKYQGDR